MAGKEIQPINLHINIPPDINPEAAAALGESIARFLAQFSGQGSAGANHRTRQTAAAKAVSDAASGEWTAAQYRAWYRDEWLAKGGEPLVNPDTKKSFPDRGVLSAFWREWIDQIRKDEAEAEAGEEAPEFREDAEVLDDEPVVQAVETPAEKPATGKPKGRPFARK